MDRRIIQITHQIEQNISATQDIVLTPCRRHGGRHANSRPVDSVFFRRGKISRYPPNPRQTSRPSTVDLSFPKRIHFIRFCLNTRPFCRLLPR